jgi:hypothetical protein
LGKGVLLNDSKTLPSNITLLLLQLDKLEIKKKTIRHKKNFLITMKIPPVNIKFGEGRRSVF